MLARYQVDTIPVSLPVYTSLSCRSTEVFSGRLSLRLSLPLPPSIHPPPPLSAPFSRPLSLSVPLSPPHSLSLCVCLSVSLSVSLSLPLSLFLSLSVCLSVSVSLSLPLSVPLSLSVCVSLPLCVSVCLSVTLSLSLSVARARVPPAVATVLRRVKSGSRRWASRLENDFRNMLIPSYNYFGWRTVPPPLNYLAPKAADTFVCLTKSVNSHDVVSNCFPRSGICWDGKCSESRLCPRVGSTLVWALLHHGWAGGGGGGRGGGAGGCVSLKKLSQNASKTWP